MSCLPELLKRPSEIPCGMILSPFFLWAQKSKSGGTLGLTVLGGSLRRARDGWDWEKVQSDRAWPCSHCVWLAGWAYPRVLT